MALMVNFTLHPAILVGKDWLYSRDYIHYLTVKLQEHFGDETVVWFSNGAEGNINHLDYKNPDQNRGFEEAERIGKKLADYTMEALANKRRLPDHIKNAVAIIQLPCRKISEEDVKNAKALWEACGGVIPSLLDGVPDEIYAREILTLAEQNRSFIETTIQAVLLGDVLFVTFPGEVFVEFALEVKRMQKRLIP